MITMKDYKNPNRRDIDYLQRLRIARCMLIFVAPLCLFAFIILGLAFLGLRNIIGFVVCCFATYKLIKKFIESIKEIPLINDEIKRLRDRF